MQIADSTDLTQPFLGQELPIYPQVNDLVRVYAPAIFGSNTYPCFIQQCVITGGVPTMRDRVPAYLFEPNGISLGPGIYDARLMTSFAGLPLYVTNCCPLGGSVASSSSSSGAGSQTPLPQIIRTNLGTNQGVAITSLTLPDITTAQGSLLLVTATLVGPSEGLALYYGGLPMNLQNSVLTSVGSPLVGYMGCWMIAGGLTGDIEAFAASGLAAAITIQALQLKGITGTADKTSSAAGLTSAPSVGTGTTTTPSEYVEASFLLMGYSGAYSWGGGFTPGGEDVTESITGTAIAVAEGYRILSSTTAPSASLSGLTQASWAGIVTTFK
jgi:hypothetical protein